MKRIIPALEVIGAIALIICLYIFLPQSTNVEKENNEISQKIESLQKGQSVELLADQYPATFTRIKNQFKASLSELVAGKEKIQFGNKSYDWLAHTLDAKNNNALKELHISSATNHYKVVFENIPLKISNDWQNVQYMKIYSY